jgi:diaminopimelate decarboxylase
MQFIQMRPKVVMIDMQGMPHLIRNNESLQTITVHERMPDHLASFNL